MKWFVAFCFISTQAFAGTATTTAPKAAAEKTALTFLADGSIAFHATGRPSALKINGEGPVPQGSLSMSDGNITGDLIVDLNKLDTGITLRTKHMKEKCLEVEKYPQAKISITEMKYIAGADSIPFSGTLSLHGVSKPVTGKMKVERKDDAMSIHADFDVKMSDYAIVVPVFAGITVEDKVAIAVDAKAQMAAGQSQVSKQ